MQIDWWTLGIQSVNVAVLVWLLQRFFWRPVAAVIDQRRANTQAELAAAKATADKATAALADVETTRAGFAAEHHQILKQAHEEAAKANAAMFAETANKVATLEAAGIARVVTEQKAGEKAWAERSSTLAVDIAGRLAARLDGPAVQASFLAWLLQQLRDMPDEARRATNGAALQAVTATPLDGAGQAHTTGLIAEALGSTPVITYRTDPALIAGLELHGPHLAVANSWRADLAQIRLDATHDDRR